MNGLTSPNLQRARGQIGLSLCGDKLEELYQSGCAKLMLPKTYGEMTEAIMLNTAGGITGGDRLTVRIQAENCALVTTTQTAEGLYRSSTEPAKIEVGLCADKAADCAPFTPPPRIRTKADCQTASVTPVRGARYAVLGPETEVLVNFTKHILCARGSLIKGFYMMVN